MDKAQQDAMKKEAGIEAAKLVKSGMIVGLGTGSTVRFLVDELGRRKQEATLYATQVPLRTMQTSFKVFEIVKAMAEQGNPNSVTDAGVGALAARSAVLGACLNVKINAAGLKDRAVADDLIGQANRIVADAEKAEREILEIVESKIK